MLNKLSQAIQNLRPDSEFVIYNDDYSTIEWHVLEGKAPTKAEIEKAIAGLEVKEAKEAADKAAARASLLERLNITEDEAKLLLS